MNLITKHLKQQKASLNILRVAICICFISLCLPAHSQTKYTRPSWWVGVAGAANFNFYNGYLYRLNQDISIPVPFRYGFGVGGFVAPLLEYHKPKTRLGFMLQEGLDNRRADFELNDRSVFARISYISVEPSLRIAPFRSNLYLYAGPTLRLLVSTTFKYKQDNLPDYPNSADPDAKAYIRSLKKDIFSMQVGAGYDIYLTPQGSRNQFVISPFVSWHPALDQNVRTIETLTQNTIRAGIALKAGRGRKVEELLPAPPEVQPVRDRDGDGVLDDEDRCPDSAGVRSLKGCPDRDGDGIANIDDKCPDVAGLARYQGCPAPDRDRDGIDDDNDKCPDVAGIARYQGCPIPDTDGDGVNDEEDKCINEKGPASNFGCPVINQDIIKRITLAAKNIFFATASDKLLSQSNKRLDDVVSIMNENQSFRLQIDGHTDDQGKDEYNQDLSDRRAASVKAYLVSKGVNQARLSSTGYGETKPIADNKTAAGRASNRRVEMTLSNY